MWPDRRTGFAGEFLPRVIFLYNNLHGEAVSIVLEQKAITIIVM